MPGSEDGVSEIIGAVLLISIVVLGLSIAGVTLLSIPPPQKTPAFAADITRIDNTIYLRHAGGDTVQSYEIRIVVDGSDKTSSFLQSGSVWSSFAAGDILQYTSAQLTTDSRVQFVYTGAGSQQAITSLQVPPAAT
jgi:hypothetical protein